MLSLLPKRANLPPNTEILLSLVEALIERNIHTCATYSRGFRLLTIHIGFYQDEEESPSSLVLLHLSKEILTSSIEIQGPVP